MFKKGDNVILKYDYFPDNETVIKAGSKGVIIRAIRMANGYVVDFEDYPDAYALVHESYLELDE